MANTYNSNQLTKSDPMRSSNFPKNIRLFFYIAQDKLGLLAAKYFIGSDLPNKSDKSFLCEIRLNFFLKVYASSRPFRARLAQAMLERRATFPPEVDPPMAETKGSFYFLILYLVALPIPILLIFFKSSNLLSI